MFKGEVLPLVGDVPPFLSLTFAVHFSLPSSLRDISTGHVSLVTCLWVSDAFPLGYCSSYSFNEPRSQGQFWTQGISHKESIDSLGSPKLPVSTHYLSQYQTPKSFIALFLYWILKLFSGWKCRSLWLKFLEALFSVLESLSCIISKKCRWLFSNGQAHLVGFPEQPSRLVLWSAYNPGIGASARQPSHAIAEGLHCRLSHFAQFLKLYVPSVRL